MLGACEHTKEVLERRSRGVFLIRRRGKNLQLAPVRGFSIEQIPP
jgi:hypothetical protein